MRSIIDIIKARRTTRAFRKDEQIKDEDMKIILEAGIWAPSGHNLQTPFFTVIQNREKIDNLNNLVKDSGKESKDEITQKMCNNQTLDIFYGAPAIIIISHEANAMTPVEDMAAATQNMLLAAESLDIASGWNGVVRLFFRKITDEEKEEFGIPKEYIPHHAIVLGYPKVKVMNVPPRNKKQIKIIK